MPTLDWLNRDAALSRADKVPYRLLNHVSSHGTGEGNLLIQGDNLEALKSLLPLYRGRVKCIYIDPPYNTKSAFEHYDDNLEHSQWLSLMWPRLALLRQLLAEDGSIWVSIDDNEGHYLKVMMDEIFGRANFVANVIWQKKYSPQNDAEFFSAMHDHIHVFAKNSSRWVRNLAPRTEKQDKAYKNLDDDPRGIWKSSDLTRAEHRDRDYYGITTPSGKVVFPARGRSWSRPPEEIERLRLDKRLWFGRNGDAIPSLKRFLTEVKDGVVPQTIWLRDEVGDNQDAKKEIKALFDDSIFDTPKPENLLRKMIEVSTKPGDLVLDSFLGSGTTAAVAHKMRRRWIGIEMGEHAITHCLPRLEKVVAGEQGGISKALNWQGGGGFQFLKLGEPVFDEMGAIHSKVRFAALAAFIWHQETGQPSDRAFDSPLLGVHLGRAIYLLFNGILGDKRPASGNVLTGAVLRAIRDILPHDGPKTIYGESVNLGPARLASEKIEFRQIPYDVKAR